MHAILVPVDFGDGCLQALRTADRLAALTGGAVAVIHVFPRGATSGGELDPAAAHLVVDGLRDAQVVRNLKGQMEEFLRQAGPAERQVLFRSGSPADAIVAAAQELGAALIVLASHGRRGLARMVLGSTAEEVVKKARCSVLTLKPDAPAFFQPS